MKQMMKTLNITEKKTELKRYTNKKKKRKR